jgi:hypothetical protein
MHHTEELDQELVPSGLLRIVQRAPQTERAFRELGVSERSSVNEEYRCFSVMQPCLNRKWRLYTRGGF